MELHLFSGVYDLPWWGLVLVALGLTHITIVAVTLFLHRCQTHHALELHAIPSHFFRFWLWMTTGMVTREWVAVHRKHHAKCETVDDPHSPQVMGINAVLWGGVVLYVRESAIKDTIERYGHGTPDDWLERNLYSKYVLLGLTLMGLTNVLLFGLVPGVLILLTQIAWIPFWAAGVINGVGHWFGYRDNPTEDASTNIVPWAIWIGGEELHNNHHAFPTSAKFSTRWWEFDVGWLYINILRALGLARVKHVVPVPRLAEPKARVDEQLLEAVITHRYDVLTHYAKSLKQTFREELQRLKQASPLEAGRLRKIRRWLLRDERTLLEREHQALIEELGGHSPALHKVVTMRHELQALWSRSMATREQLVAQLQDWCQRAEQSGIAPLADFSRRLRSYA
jgi:stearoyl-CoA desaturase (delta-9 desaturase)